MVNYKFNSAAMPEFDPPTPHDHCIGDFDGFTGDILEWPLLDSCVFDCPTEPRVDLPDVPDLPPKLVALVEEGLKSSTMRHLRENVNSNYSITPERPDPLKASDDFNDEDDINRWVDSCLNFSPTSDQPCVEATGNIVDAIEISSIQPSTSSSQPVNVDVALSGGKSPQPLTIAMLDDSDAQGKKTKRQRWSPEEHRLFLMGIKRYGRNWKIIAEEIVKTKTHIQIASHAQKYSLRCKSNGSDTDGTAKRKKKRKSIHDVTINHVPDLD